MDALRVLSIALFFCGVSVGQHTWKVSCHGGPGIDFTDLPPAVAAAAPGDTIWVFDGPSLCSGGFPGYTAPTIDKPLNILGFHIYPSVPPVGAVPTVAALNGILQIANIPLGQRVVVSNVGFGTFILPETEGLQVTNCAGEIIVEGVGFTTAGGHGGVYEVMNSTNVVLRGCSIRYCGWSMRIVNSNVRMSGMSMQGTAPWSSSVLLTPAITINNSTVTITRSLIRGASGTPARPIDDHPGIVMVNSVLYAGPGANIYGGSEYGVFPISYHYGVLGVGPALNPVYRGPRTLITGVGTTEIQAAIDAVAIDYAVANDNLTAFIAGPSGGFALLMVGDLAPAPVATPYGSLLVDPCSASFVDLLPLPTSVSGYVIKDYFVPAYAQYAHAYALQALTLSPTGVLGLTWPTPFCVGWEHGRIP